MAFAREKFLEALQAYEHAIEPLLNDSSGLTAFNEDENTLQIGRGMIYPRALGAQEGFDTSGYVERLIELARSPSLAALGVVDRAGHQRPVYRPLLLYAWLMTYRIQFESLSRDNFGRWDEALRGWCDALADSLSQVQLATPIAASSGAYAGKVAWNALALFVAGKLFIRDPWTDLAAGLMGQLARAQGASGAFLCASASDQPETRWYDELVILHAAAGYAVQAEDRVLASCVERATQYHLLETQPDHATAQPWSLFAFIWNERSRPLADQILHTAQMALAGQPSSDPVSLILLADCLYCLRLFL